MPNQLRITLEIGIQILSWVELVEEASVVPIEGAINQPIVEEVNIKS
jgi:hypothetical protein